MTRAGHVSIITSLIMMALVDDGGANEGDLQFSIARVNARPGKGKCAPLLYKLLSAVSISARSCRRRHASNTVPYLGAFRLPRAFIFLVKLLPETEKSTNSYSSQKSHAVSRIDRSEGGHLNFRRAGPFPIIQSTPLLRRTHFSA